MDYGKILRVNFKTGVFVGAEETRDTVCVISSHPTLKLRGARLYSSEARRKA
jgi:hypothetical protein